MHFLIISWKDAGIKLKLCDLMWSRSWRRECSCHVNNEWPVAWMQKCVINLLKCNAEVLILILKSDKSHIFNIYMYIYIFVFSCNNYHDYAKKKITIQSLLWFDRTLSKAQELESQVRNRQIEKEYISRVQGEFPRWCAFFFNEERHCLIQDLVFYTFIQNCIFIWKKTQ